MKPDSVKLLLTTSPYLKYDADTPYVMRHVIYALIPASVAGMWVFGINAIVLIATCIISAVLTEYVAQRWVRRVRPTLHDGSAVLTGLLLALIVPPGLPLWMAALGSVVSIVLGKLIFGGLGGNIFNPALVGRAFLQASFPVALTTWSEAGNWSTFSAIKGTPFALPFVHSSVDGISGATPLAAMKFEGQLSAISEMFWGSTSGSLGETGAVWLLLGGLYLALRGFLNWRIPVGIFATVFLLSAGLQAIDPVKFAPPLFHLFGGGLMLGAIYMATDPVSSPITQKGCWWFAFGIGLLVVVIRNFGGLPEGVMYAILLMNGLTPLINRVTHRRIYGEKVKGFSS